MKLRRIAITPYITQQERQLLQNVMPWHKDYWDSDVIIGGINYKDDIALIKSKIRTALNAVTNSHCTYCGSLLKVTSDDHLDHFAPKYKYPEFTFELNNLFPACTKCNLSTRKGKKLTIRKFNTKYAKCRFKIVHPHFDNPDKHFDYVINSDRKVIIKWKTKKGRKTITFFKLNEPNMTIDRAKTYIYEATALASRYEALLDENSKNGYSKI